MNIATNNTWTITLNASLDRAIIILCHIIILHMSDACVPNEHWIGIAVAVLFHVVILFFILSMFFIFYSSEVASTAFNQELKYLVKDNITESLNSLNEAEQLALKGALIDVNFDRLIKYYSREDPTRAETNKW